MNLSSSIIFDLASGASRVQPEANDGQPQVPAMVMPVVQAVLKANLPTGVPVVLPADQSTIAADAQTIPASTGATLVTMVQLAKGSYTIDLFIAARFVGTPSAGSVPDCYIDISNLSGTVREVLLGFYAQTLTAPQATRRFELTLGFDALIRRQTNATGVGQTIDATWCVNVERHL